MWRLPKRKRPNAPWWFTWVVIASRMGSNPCPKLSEDSVAIRICFASLHKVQARSR
jgi:hypothetical protein